jgi:hypothetical protein
MGGKGKDAAQRLLAIIVIIAMMTAMGIQPPVIFFFAIVIYFVWRAVQHTERQETNRVFDFYANANAILRDEERRWYGFEIANVTQEGERLLREMIDPPPLVFYALGALYHRIGDYGSAQVHLAHLVETEEGDESRRLIASVELRRYVETLRRLERDPAEKPQMMAAVRSLERARRTQAREMLDDARAHLTVNQPQAVAASSTQQLPRERAVDGSPSVLAYPSSSVNDASSPGAAPGAKAENAQGAPHDSLRATSKPKTFTENASAPEPSVLLNEPRRPITEVLRDVYEEEKKTA